MPVSYSVSRRSGAEFTIAVAAASLSYGSDAVAQTAAAEARDGSARPAAAAVKPATGGQVFESVLLLGSTALSPSLIGTYVAPYVGRPVTPDLLRRVRLAVSAAHDDAGFGLVSVDEPLMQGTVALVRVQQLSLDRVGVEAAEAGSKAPGKAARVQIVAALPALRVGETPNLKRLDRQIRLANLQPHRRLSVDFRALDNADATAAPQPAPADARAPLGPTAFGVQQGQPIAAANDAPKAVPPLHLPGFSTRANAASTIDARILTSATRSTYGRVLLDNAGQPTTGRERLRVQIGHGDLLGPGHSVDLTGLVSVPHPNRQHQIAVRYQNPLPEMGTLLIAEASISRSKPGLVNDFFDISGNSKIVSLTARHLLPRSATLEPYVEVGFEMAVHNDVVDFFGVNLGSQVGTSPLAVSFAATWQQGALNAFGQVRGRHNIGLGADSGALRYDAARVAATPRWTTIDAFAVVRRAMGGGQEAVVRAQGQLTGDALIAPQQFRAGGQANMRGLIESEMAGDSGAAVSFEYWWALGGGHRVAGLVDTAVARRNKALANEAVRIDATSAGLAWQWSFARRVQLNVAAARILATRSLPRSRKGDNRLHLLLEWAL